MKICGISDIHGNLLQNIPKCDVLCICGDTINLNDQRDIPASKKWWETKFIKWINKLPCERVVVIAGNHDFYLEDVYKKGDWELFSDYMSILSNSKAVFLMDQEYEYKGIKFYGTPWINPIQFQENRWAFSSNKYYENISNCDVLITHENPFKNHYLDYYSTGKYKLHYYGHWHDGQSDIGTGRYNCSRLDDYYRFKKDYGFIIIDIMTNEEKIKVEQNFLDVIIGDLVNRLKSPSDVFSADVQVLTWLNTFKQDLGPKLQQQEDEIPWDTHAEIPESSVINDMED